MLLAMDPPKAMTTENDQWQDRYFGPHKIVRETLLKYAQVNLPGPYSTLWTVMVFEDGWGDLANFLQSIKIFKERYPHWPMRAIIGIEKPSNTDKDWLKRRIEEIPFDFKDFGLNEDEILILPYRLDLYSPIWNPRSDEAEIFEKLLLGRPIEGHANNEMLPKLRDFAEFVDRTELIINISTFFSFSTKNRPQIPHLFLSEYGTPHDVPIPHNLQKEIFSTKIENTIWRMGLGPFCLGIFNLSPKIADSFENENLKKYYNEDSYNFFNYKVPINRFVASIFSIYPDLDVVTIVSTGLKPKGTDIFDAKIALNETTSLDIETEYKYTKVVLIDKSGGEQILHDLGQYRRKVILVDAFPLSNADFNRALSLAKPPVGITGNVSLSEALDHLPYYYPANRSGSIFFGQMITLAKAALVDADDLISYLDKIQKQGTASYATYKNFDTLNPPPQSLPQIEAAWSVLAGIIKIYWDVKPMLLGLINMRLAASSEYK